MSNWDAIDRRVPNRGMVQNYQIFWQEMEKHSIEYPPHSFHDRLYGEVLLLSPRQEILQLLTMRFIVTG